MKQRREKIRNMCAEILTIRWTENDGTCQSELVSLEDITATGACLHMEHSIPVDTKVSLHHANGKYEGMVKYCTCQETGYVLGIAFDDNYRWSKTDFQPSHLLELHPKTVASLLGKTLPPKTSHLIH